MAGTGRRAKPPAQRSEDGHILTKNGDELVMVGKGKYVIRKRKVPTVKFGNCKRCDDVILVGETELGQSVKLSRWSVPFADVAVIRKYEIALFVVRLSPLTGKLNISPWIPTSNPPTNGRLYTGHHCWEKEVRGVGVRR